MVAGKQRILLQQRIADMVGRVPGRVQGLQGPSFALEDLAVDNLDVRLETDIIAGLEADLAAGRCRLLRTETIDFRPMFFGQRVGEGRMIEMMMGDKDVADGLALEGSVKRGDVLRVDRAGVNDGD
jgi:hypothetical protein